jgi:hypothetical protein
MAITWRTLNNPVGTGVGLLMNGAAQSLDGGFTALQNVLTQRNKTQDANWDNTKANNTNDYLNAVQDTIKDPNAVNDPTVQANLAALKQQFGYQIDANAIRGADEKRVSALQKQGLDSIEYNDKTRIDSERDTVDEIAAHYQAGDYAGGDKLREGKNLRDDALLSKLREEALRGFNTESRSAQSASDSHLTSALNRKIGQSNLDWSNSEHAYTLKERKEQEAVDSAVTGALVSQQQQEALQQADQADAAKGLNIPKDAAGNLDINAADLITQGVYQKRLAASQATGAPSDTQVRNDLTKSLLGIPGVSPKQVTDATASVSGMLATQAALHPTDQAKLDKVQAVEDLAFKTKVTQMEESHKRQLDANAYASGEFDGEKATVDVISGIREDFDPIGVDVWQRKDLISNIRTALTEGVKLKNPKTGDVETIIPSPGAVKLAMQEIASNWSVKDEDTRFDEAMQDYFQRPEVFKKVKDGAELRAKLNTEKAELNTNYLKNTSKRQAEARRQAGLPGGSSRDIFNALTNTVNLDAALKKRQEKLQPEREEDEDM